MTDTKPQKKLIDKISMGIIIFQILGFITPLLLETIANKIAFLLFALYMTFAIIPFSLIGLILNIISLVNKIKGKEKIKINVVHILIFIVLIALGISVNTSFTLP